MISLLVSMILLTSVQPADDGDRVRLTFDGPVSFTQSLAATPARVILTVPGAGTAPAAAEQAAGEGLTVRAIDDPSPGLRITIPVPAAASASVEADGNDILVTFRHEGIVVPATPRRAASSDNGGIAAPVSTPSAGDYMIGPEDLVEVNVFELPELKTSTRVLGDGTVSLPLIGVVQAAGLTKTGFEARLRDLLESRFLLDPQVSVNVTEYRSKLVSVIGAVTEPGTYQMLGPRTVLQVLSEAGGLTKEAGDQIIILRRRDSGESERLSLDLDDLVIRGNPALNVALEPGDVINVPIDRPIYVFVDGAVRQPGQVEGKMSRPISLLQAIARAGGLTERANTRGVHVLRKSDDGAQLRIPVNLKSIRKGKADDIMLEDGDVIVVPETFF